MATTGRSVMVHIEGTRSLECRTPVQKMSGAFIDMALQVGVPIVPVRFVGGLPAETMESRIEFPTAWASRTSGSAPPSSPRTSRTCTTVREAARHRCHQRPRPDNADEQPLPGDAAFAEDVAAWQSDRGITEEHATLMRILQERTEPSAPVKALLSAATGGSLALGDGDRDAWMKVLAQWTLGQTEESSHDLHGRTPRTASGHPGLLPAEVG